MSATDTIAAAIPEDPPGFVVRTEAQKVAFDNGYRLERGVIAGWMRFASTTAHGDVWIAGASSHGPWLLSLDHPGVAAEFKDPMAPTIVGPGIATLTFTGLPELYAAMERVYRLGCSLPDAPLLQFKKKTKGMPQTTEAERLVVQRVGQDVFREALLRYWNSRCPLTGVSDGRLLRASHIKPWASCETDAERLDVHNGLLLTAHLDAAFDAGLITFADHGLLVYSPAFAAADRAAIGLRGDFILSGMTADHQSYMAWHRERVFVQRD